jgi:hypothetical protein
MRSRLAIVLAVSSCLFAADPVFLRRQVSDVKPLFGIGDPDADQLKGVARYGELTVSPGGTLLYGYEKAPIKPNELMYLPVGVKHGIANSSAAPVKVMVM